MLHELIQINYGTVIVVFMMLVFIGTNDMFEKDVVRRFTLASCCVLTLVIVDSIEYWTASFTYPVSLRIWMSAIGYSLRPAIVYIVILMLTRNRKMNRMIFALPLMVNALIAFSALFTDVAFAYSETNEFIRGPLGYAAFFTSGIYLIALVITTINLYKNKNIFECLIAFAVVVLSSLATFLESVWKYEGLINATGAVSITFYYLYLNTQQFKRDPLTGAFNRRCFYLDADKGLMTLKAIISVDLNNLKQINDRMGHAEGDKAICTTVRCIQEALDKNCYLYRTGGDEFMILCFKISEDEVVKVIQKIQQNINATPYSCAIGAAYMYGERSFEKVCAEADEAMYQDKMRIKGGNVR